MKLWRKIKVKTWIGIALILAGLIILGYFTIRFLASHFWWVLGSVIAIIGGRELI